MTGQESSAMEYYRADARKRTEKNNGCLLYGCSLVPAVFVWGIVSVMEPTWGMLGNIMLLGLIFIYLGISRMNTKLPPAKMSLVLWLSLLCVSGILFAHLGRIGEGIQREEEKQLAQKQKDKQEKLARIKSLIKEAKKSITTSDTSKAFTLLRKVHRVTSGKNGTANRVLKELKLITSKKYLIQVIKNMSEQEYSKFEKNGYVAARHKVSTPEINNLLKRKLHLLKNEATKLRRQMKRERRQRVQNWINQANHVARSRDLCGRPKAIANAWNLLRKIRRQDRVYKKASNATKRLERCRRRAEREWGQALRGVMKTQRSTHCAKLHKIMVSRGIRVSCHGKYSETIKFKWVLFSRSSSRVFLKPIFQGLEKIGFRYIYVDNSRRAWSYKLHPQDESKAGKMILNQMGLGSPLKFRYPETKTR